MWENIDIDRRHSGEFKIDGEDLHGEIIYNKGSGRICLKIVRRVHGALEKSYGFFPVISGKLNSGAIVSLYRSKCI